MKYSRRGNTRSYTVCYNKTQYANILDFFVCKHEMYATIENINILTDINSIFNVVKIKFSKYVNEKNFNKFFQKISVQVGSKDIICVDSITCKSLIMRNTHYAFITNLSTTCTHS